MKRTIFFFTFLFFATTTFSQDSTVVEKHDVSFFDWCIQDNITHFTFITDMKQLQKEKESKEYQPGKLVINHHGNPDTLKVKIKARGNMRQKVCHFPPIKFKIDGEELDSLDLDDIKSYKMVTHCKRFSNNEQWVYKELVAYKMYETVTDVSFRTHKITVDYIDENSNKIIESKVGFVIESEKDVEKRLNAIVVERTRSHPRHNVPYYVIQMSMFQYLIGNTDWSFANMHNLIIIKLPEYPLTVPIAYDFDYSGLVSTDYSVPDPQLRIDKVTQRLYRDVCQEREIVEQVIQNFSSKKEDIIKCIYGVEELKESEQRSIFKFIEDFFERIEDPKSMDNTFLSSCKD